MKAGIGGPRRAAQRLRRVEVIAGKMRSFDRYSDIRRDIGAGEVIEVRFFIRSLQSSLTYGVSRGTGAVVRLTSKMRRAAASAEVPARELCLREKATTEISATLRPST